MKKETFAVSIICQNEYGSAYGSLEIKSGEQYNYHRNSGDLWSQDHEITVPQEISYKQVADFAKEINCSFHEQTSLRYGVVHKTLLVFAEAHPHALCANFLSQYRITQRKR